MARFLIVLAGVLACLPAKGSGPFLVDPSRSELLAVSFAPDRSQIGSGGLAGVAVFEAIDRAGIEPDPGVLDLNGFVGQEIRATVSLLSIGDRPLRIDGLALDDLAEVGWHIEDVDCLPEPLESGTRCDFELVFAPTSLDSFAGTVSILSNATVLPLELALTANVRTTELFRDRFESGED